MRRARRLKVQRNHAEIAKTLSVVRASFQKFQKNLQDVLKRLDQTRDELSETVDRTGKIDRRLKSFDVATADVADAMLPPTDRISDDDSDHGSAV